MTTLLHPKAEVNNAKIHTYIKKIKTRSAYSPHICDG